jgi:hypothetical protein
MVKTDFEFKKLYVEDGVSIFLRNAGNKLPYYSATKQTTI